MKEKLRSAFLMIAVAVALILLGIGAYLRGYSNSKNSIYEEHVTHLNDIVEITDRNIFRYFSERLRDLNFLKDRSQEYLDTYLKTGNSADLLSYMRECMSFQEDAVHMILLMNDEENLLCTECGKNCVYSFPYGRGAEGPTVCLDENGTAYIAVTGESGRDGYYYSLLIDPEGFYSEVIGTYIYDYYWLTLYNSESSIFLQSDRNQPTVRRVSLDEALERQDGLAIMAKGERDGVAGSGTYYFSSPLDSSLTEYLIFSLPRHLSDNRWFSIGVAVESEHYISRIAKTYRWAVTGTVLILLGVALITAIIVIRTMENRKEQQTIDRLEMELDTLENLSHHQRLEMIGMMTGSISHELRNILTPIMGYSMMALNKVPDGNDDLMKDIAQIYDASSRARRLVTRLLSLSYKNNEKQRTRFGVEEIVGNVAELSRPLLPEKVTLKTEVLCKEAMLYADRAQIGQVFMNIVINAIQAMEKDGGSLLITAGAEEETIRFRFTDTGPGIPEEVLPRIFDPFYSTKGVEKGIGLGLAIVQHIVTEHGGTVEAQSSAGNGTTITVTLPRDKETGEAPEP